MNQLKTIVSILIVICSAFLCHQIVTNSISNQNNKNDYAELNHVKYGLLSINEWKRQITFILAEEINKLYLSKSNEAVLRKHIEALLGTLIDKVDKQIKKGNSGSAGGMVTQSFINIFINLEEIKKGIPEYTDAVIREINKSKTKREVKSMLNKQLKKYSEQTFDTQDTSILNGILLKINSKSIEEARVKLYQEISIKHNLIKLQVTLLISLTAYIFIISSLSKESLTPSIFIGLVILLIILLIAGVTTPTIDMEAKISQMSFELFGYPIHFENQVLYFQSKSILDVFWIMITHPDIQMKLVGVLLITFSILFPLSKIALSPFYYFNFYNARNSPLVKFIIEKSGKWSMADVMVVAIFMAYIGFNGIITSQFGHLDSSKQELVILTTNATSLQPGYYLFLTYTLFALHFTGLLVRKTE